MHEVVVSEGTLAAVKEAENSDRSTWRVSSTLFAHIASDEDLSPIGKFKTQESLKLYPSILAGDQVANQLKKINLHWK